jgi:hypothetical protein
LRFSMFIFQFAISLGSTGRSVYTDFDDTKRDVNLQWLSPGKSRFDIVPPFNLVAFVGFPTEQNDAAIAHRGKVD